MGFCKRKGVACDVMDSTALYQCKLTGCFRSLPDVNTSKPKPTFEQCLDHIETTLGYKLLDWQKEYLHTIYNYPDAYIIPARHNGITMFREATKILYELLGEERIVTREQILEWIKKVNNKGE